jgi:lysophospholipase L1-like esterase
MLHIYGLVVSKTFTDLNIMQATAVGCKPTLDHSPRDQGGCAALMDYIYDKYLLKQKIDVILIEAHWAGEDLPLLARTLDYAKVHSGAVVLFGPMVQYDAPLPRLLAVSMLKNDHEYIFHHLMNKYVELDKKMAKLAHDKHIYYISFFDILCGGGDCETISADGTPTLFDDGHLTAGGATRVAAHLRDRGDLPVWEAAGIGGGTAAKAHAPANGTPVKIMPLGDSITGGCCNSTYGGYRHLLYELLTRAGVNFDFVGSVKNGDVPDADNEGHGGWPISKLQSEIDRQGWLATFAPDIVLLHIGTNDMYSAGTAQKAPAQLSALIDDIMARLPKAHIVVAQILPAVDANWEVNIERHNAAIPAIVSAKGPRVSMVNMHDALSAADLSDGLHPSNAGYDKMAHVWETAILALLSGRGIPPGTPPRGTARED